MRFQGQDIPGVDENQEEKRTFIDAVDDLDFCIDLYAGDASGGGDGKDWRKVFISYGRMYFTIRGLTLDQNYSMSKIIEGPRRRINNSM